MNPLLLKLSKDIEGCDNLKTESSKNDSNAKKIQENSNSSSKINEVNSDGKIAESNSELSENSCIKKLSNESLNKALVRTLKDCIVLSKYIDYGHDRTINNLKLLINSYEQNFKSIRSFLQKRRKVFCVYFFIIYLIKGVSDI